MKIHSNKHKSALSIFWALLFFNILLQCTPLQAASKHPFRFEGFTGGMMIHTGYVRADGLNLNTPSGETLENVKMSGMPFGIGGAIKIHLGQHLRIGSEGYSTRLNYGVKSSSSHIGWGGLLLDGTIKIGDWNLFAGGTIGGGGSTNITLTNPYKIDEVIEENVSFRKYAFFCLCPFIGFEYSLTEKINFTAKVDWLFNASNPQADFTTGPRLYIGIMFRHKRAGQSDR